MQWGEGKAGLDRVLDNNSGQIKTCLQVIIIIIIITIAIIIIVMMMFLRTIYRLATDKVRAWSPAVVDTLVATPCQIGGCQVKP